MNININTVCICEIKKSRSQFESADEFYHFVEFIEKNKLFMDVPVKKSYCVSNLDETWYQCVECKNVWRLVKLDPPFEGMWELVEEDD